MKNIDIKNGDKVKAIFRKYGNHTIIGTILVKNKVGVMVPIKDVKEVLA